MDKQDKLKELEDFLNLKPKFTQKSEVVYFLSEIRKVIENKKGYRDLNFYCNWVLHSELTKESTVKILSSKLDKFIDFSKSKNEIQEMIRKADNGGFIKMEDFRSGLMKFLNNFNLPKNNLDGNDWHEFRKVYLEIIHQCPINKDLIGISGLHLTKEKNGYYYEFYINKAIKIPRIKLKLK